MKRKPVTSLIGQKIAAIVTKPSVISYLLEFRGDDGRVLFTVFADDIFDEDGNRLETDTALKVET